MRVKINFVMPSRPKVRKPTNFKEVGDLPSTLQWGNVWAILGPCLGYFSNIHFFVEA